MRMHDDGLFTSQRKVSSQIESRMGGTPPDGRRFGHVQQSDSDVRDLPQEHAHLWERLIPSTLTRLYSHAIPGLEYFTVPLPVGSQAIVGVDFMR